MNKLIIIFLLALFLRFLYFPENIYFGYDQARDAYVSLDILKGDLKIVGPPTSVEGLYHGVLYYYILAPLYLIGNHNPEFIAVALKVFNASGIFLIFFIGSILFNQRVGAIASLLYAVSFEQTQFSIYMGNPTLAVLSVLLMYTGLAMVIFKQRSWGFPLATLGLGFSIQFQFALIYLFIPFLVLLVIFRKIFLNFPLKIWLFSAASLILSLLTFILAEIKYNFRTLNTLSALSGAEKNMENILKTYVYTLQKMISFNLTESLLVVNITMLVLLILFTFFLYKKKISKQLIFLSIWFFSIIGTILVSGGVADLRNNVPLYYPNVGVSLALLIFVAFLVSRLFERNKLLGILILGFIIGANLNMVQSFNQKGTVSEINVQQGMLLSDEKKVLDYMYNESGSQLFAAKGITMPFYINTTWSYLFEWYGKKTYGYIPIWNGKNAEGFPGNLKVVEVQEGLPPLRFLIIEPTRGVPTYLIDEYLKEESYFTKVVDEKKFGEFIVQKREKF